jgi:2,3,4,5-tetrahydropyridine-2-carboxylate N-succinyltransferase
MPVGFTGIAAVDFQNKDLDRFSSYTHNDFVRNGLRITTPVIARRGSYIGQNVQLKPSFIDIGAFIDNGTTIEAWVSVGAGAQIGRNVHLCEGVTIEGNLESFHIDPAIIEDNCYISAHCSIAEGIIIEQSSVLAAGVHINPSTPIYDRENDLIMHGSVPAGSVVIPGTILAKNKKYSLSCAIIIRRVDARTRANASIHDLLRQT